MRMHGFTLTILVRLRPLIPRQTGLRRLTIPLLPPKQKDSFFVLAVSCVGFIDHKAGVGYWEVLVPAPFLELILVKLFTSD